MESKIEIYKTSTGTEINVKLEEDTIWLDSIAIADLFGVNRPAIVKHVGNIYKSEELEKDSTCSILEQVAAAAMVDRLTHRAYLVDMTGPSYRVKETRKWNEQKRDVVAHDS